MNVIYKYLIPLRTPQVVHKFDLPPEAKVLHVGSPDPANVLIWVEQGANYTGPPEQRAFRVYGTGHSIAPEEVIDYVGSVVVDPFVWHVYEVVS